VKSGSPAAKLMTSIPLAFICFAFVFIARVREGEMLLRLASSIFMPLFREYSVFITTRREKGNKNRMFSPSLISE
jgi:hypothetical protein